VGGGRRRRRRRREGPRRMHGRREKRSCEINREVNVRSGEGVAVGVADCSAVLRRLRSPFGFFSLLFFFLPMGGEPDSRFSALQGKHKFLKTLSSGPMAYLSTPREASSLPFQLPSSTPTQHPPSFTI